MGCQTRVTTVALITVACALLEVGSEWLTASPAPFPNHRQLRMFTARAPSTAIVASEAIDCTPISIFVLVRRGSVSVGLNAVEFVNETYK